MILRDYQKGDEEAVYRLVQKVLAGYGLATNPKETDKDLSDIQKNYLRPGGCFRVIENDGKIIGSYGIYVLSSGTCELRKMYLLPVFQGRGMGKLMVEEALKFARKKGFKEMVLETNSRLKNAVALYRKYGFKSYDAEHLSDRCDGAMKLRL